MDANKLLAALRGDSMARLRHLVLRRAGLCPFGLRAKLVSDARVLEEACFMLLEGEGIPPAADAAMMARRVVAPYGWGGAGDAEKDVPLSVSFADSSPQRGEPLNGDFDMERFLEMKEAADERV